MDCPFSFDDVHIEIDDAENQENSHPNISTVDHQWMNQFVNATGVTGSARNGIMHWHSGSMERSLASRFLLIARNMIGFASSIQNSVIGFLRQSKIMIR